MSAKLSAIELLELMRLGDYKIEIVGDVLEVSPAFSIDDEMADYLRIHKAEIIKILHTKNL